MLDYKNYEVKDFIADESFRQWTLHNEAREASFWDTWLDNNPDRAFVVEEAQYLLLTHKDTLGFIDEIEIKEEAKSILNKIRKERTKANKIIPFIYSSWFKVAASVAVTIGLGVLMYFVQNTRFLHESSIAASNSHSEVKYVCSTDQSKLVTLPDGSSVILHKKSSISFPEHFGTDKREVVLSGEAFFEVAKNPSKPFYIYANGLTTKVLGTSFIISAYKKDKQVKVIVKTGKVTVFPDTKEDRAGKSGGLSSKELIVLPNQQMLFDRQESSMLVSQITEVSPLNKVTLNPHFAFKKRPVYEVFGVLEKYYGVKIMVDTAGIENRSITALLTDEPFGNKLDIICEAIDARYEKHNETVKIYIK